MITYTINATDKKGWIYSVDVLYPQPAPVVRHPEMAGHSAINNQTKSNHMLQLSEGQSEKPHYYVFPGLKSVRVPIAHGYYPPSERLDFIMGVVIEEFTKRFDFDREKMMSGTREMPHALARMVFYYFARIQCPTLTLREIASSFPMLKQHHTTIMHASTAVQNILDTKDVHYYEIVSAIEEKLS